MYEARGGGPNPAGSSEEVFRTFPAEAVPKAADLCEEVASLLEDSTCVVGVGNRLRQDDGAGVLLAERLVAAGLSSPANTIFAEDVPESFLVPVADGPWHRVLVVDAVQAEAPPATILFGRANELLTRWSATSTHNASLRLCCELWEKEGKEVFFLGIVPASLEFCAPPTNTIRTAIDLLISEMTAGRKGRLRHVG